MREVALPQWNHHQGWRAEKASCHRRAAIPRPLPRRCARQRDLHTLQTTQPGSDLLAAQRQQMAVVCEHCGMFRLLTRLPIENGGLERLHRRWIGYSFPSFGILERRKLAELLTPTLADRVAQILAEIAEEQKRLRCRPFLTHEKKRW